MSFLHIDSSTLRKLTHESDEIRLRTLEHVANKLNRALALGEKVDVKPVELCKQLIRWFGYKPLADGLKVLNLLKDCLSSPEYGEKAINSLGIERLRKELRKIQELFKDKPPELRVIKEIDEFLKRQELREQRKKYVQDDLEEMTSLTDRLTVEDNSANLNSEFNNEDYEIAWSRPTTSDYTSMKLVADILINKSVSLLELKNALIHLEITMKDYPAEYLLQAPHIFRRLLNVYKGDLLQFEEIPVDTIAAALMEFLNVLEKRLEYRKKSLFFPYKMQASDLSKSQTPSQLKVQRALHDLLSASITHVELKPAQTEPPSKVWAIVFKILKLHGILKLPINYNFVQKLAKLHMRLSARLSDAGQVTRLRLYQMHFIFLLQDIVQNNVANRALEESATFELLLKDYTVKCLYPERFQQLQKVLWNNDCIRQKYQALEDYEQSVRLAANILNFSKTNAKEIIENGKYIAAVLEILQSKRLVDILYSKLVEAIPLYLSNEDLRIKAIELILDLLNVSFQPLKVYAYESFVSLFKSHVGCLMNGETYVKECSNSSLLKATIIGVPLNASLILNIVHNSYESDDASIQNICIKVLELLLQSSSLLADNWCTFVELLVSVLPLISCCSFSTKVMDVFMKLNDPDARQLPFVITLQGNIALLFHTQSERRSEALTRLVYTLNSIKGEEKYMPNLSQISDTLPNDLCVLKAPREYHHIFSDRSTKRNDSVATLNNLFNLLESPDVEPLIRKTTLMQINVLCTNWHMSVELCNAGAYFLILQALENAMQISNYSDYPDAAVPAISILSKILFCDSSARCELAETPNIYVLLLRALMMFNHDIQMRQDAALCLFQLVFANQLIATENQVEGPSILGNLKLPLNINLKRKLPTNGFEHDTRQKINTIFDSSMEENQYWRCVIAEVTFKGLHSVNHKMLIKQAQLDIKEDLKLTPDDVRIIKATQPGVSLKRLVDAASNATDHNSLTQICLMLQQQLLLPQMVNTFQVSLESGNILSQILLKYLQLQPSNNQDLELYKHLLHLSKTCLQLRLMVFVTGLITSLHKDNRHALITMLTQKEETPLEIFYQISKFLEILVNEQKLEFLKVLSGAECSAFFSNLFDLLMEKSLQLFELRDLQRVRCLLSLMLAIAACNLDMPDKLLLYYCRRFFQLSLALKSFTQTGSQWHRDCLLSILRLQQQMQDGTTAFSLTPGIVKYLSGLCGHTDAQVRVLVWSILYLVSETKPIANSDLPKNAKTSECSGVDMLLNELAYLPGGFMACCLSTLLDLDEVIWIRELAGQLLANLLSNTKDVKKTEQLLESYKFLRTAGEALNSSLYVFSHEVPEKLQSTSNQITTCELIRSYTCICIAMSKCSPDFLSELCTRSFMFKLYEVFKHPVTLADSKSYFYINMVSDICLLYTICSKNNCSFLQWTLSRDPVWLDSYCKILFLNAPPNCYESKIVVIMQLLILLFNDDTALEHLSIKMVDYSPNIVTFFQYAFDISHYGTSLQKCVLSVLSLLCIKAQQPEVEAEVRENILQLLDGQHILNDSIELIGGHESADKENQRLNVKNTSCSSSKKSPHNDNQTSSAVSEHLCISLIRLFTHLYPMKVCKFTIAPTDCQQQVVETLALLLKVSPTAQETAHNLKTHEQVISIFKYFFEEFATMSCTTFVKRHGEIKKLTVVKNIQLLFKFLLNWHSAPTMIIKDEILAAEYSKMIIQIWPWLAHSAELKLTVLKVCAFLCERSLIMCKRFSSVNNSSFAHSILQLTIKLATADTKKVNASSVNYFPVIFFGVRVITNCCSCIEGRTTINKAHVMDLFDCLYPFNPKAFRMKSDIVEAWLQFWEIFSRYEEGASAHHLKALCSVINQSKGETRILCVRILRNMTFLNSNRATLLNSNEFIYTVNEIVSQPLDDEQCSVEEQLTVCVGLWQLISGGVKYAAMIRGTKLSKQLRVLQDSVKGLMGEKKSQVEYGEKLLDVLLTIFKIFEM